MGPLRTEGWGGLSTHHAITRSVRDSAAILDATHGVEPGSRYGAPAPAEGFAAQPVYFGGPVQTDRGFVLHGDDSEWNSTLHVAPGLSVTTSRDILEALSRGDGPARVLVALGYAGWEAGQLEDELAQNSWLTVPVDRGIVFDTPLEDRWRAAARQLGVDLSTLTDYSGHA